MLLSFPVPLDSSGALDLGFQLGPTFIDAWLQLQFVGLDGGAPGGASMSNGLGFH